MNIDARAQVPANAGQHLTLKQYAKDKLHEEIKDYADTGKSLGRETWAELKGFATSKTYGEALKSGVSHGLKSGYALGHLFRVPLGVAAGATALAIGGVPAAMVYSALGGFEVGSAVGDVVGRLSAAHDGGKKQDVRGTAGSLLGGVGGAILTYANPVAAMIGAFKVGEAVAEGALSLAGAAIGGVVGLVTHTARLGVGALINHFHPKPEEPKPQDPATPPAPTPAPKPEPAAGDKPQAA